MVEKEVKLQDTVKKRKGFSCINIICWMILPTAIIILLVLDGFEIYTFNTERLIVIGACIIVVLIPFFNEITIKNISIKKTSKSK